MYFYFFINRKYINNNDVKWNTNVKYSHVLNNSTLSNEASTDTELTNDALSREESDISINSENMNNVENDEQHIETNDSASIKLISFEQLELVEIEQLKFKKNNVEKINLIGQIGKWKKFVTQSGKPYIKANLQSNHNSEISVVAWDYGNVKPFVNEGTVVLLCNVTTTVGSSSQYIAFDTSSFILHTFNENLTEFIQSQVVEFGAQQKIEAVNRMLF